MDKVVTNRKSFLASMGALAVACFAFPRKDGTPRADSSAGPAAEKLPMRVTKAPRTVARGGDNA